MPRQNDFYWCSTKLFPKLVMVFVLLQFSLGYDFTEDDPASSPAFYGYPDDGFVPEKMPRGYVMPYPRLGRSAIYETKRQSMIPQPRIGRELEVGHELAEILNDVQNILHDTKFQPPIEYLDHRNSIHEETPTAVSGDVIAKYQKYFPGDLGNSDKDSAVPSEEIDDVPRLSDEDSLNLFLVYPGRKVGIPFSPKEDRNFLKETKNSGFDESDSEKRDEILKKDSNSNKAKLLAALDAKNQIGGLIAYPRLGREIWHLQPTFFPALHDARPESSAYEVLLSPNLGTTGLEDSLRNAVMSNQLVLNKKHTIQFIPRIGRRKRSVQDGHNKDHEIQTPNNKNDDDVSSSENDRDLFHSLQELDDDYYYRLYKKNLRSKNAFIPRVGKKNFYDLDDYENKRAAALSPRIGRIAAFTPRVGRTSAFTPGIGRAAAAFTPRVGRAASFTPRIGKAAALIPRIGRTDPRFRLSSRGAFVPRVGKRAALIPRVGRSTSEKDSIKRNK